MGSCRASNVNLCQSANNSNNNLCNSAKNDYLRHRTMTFFNFHHISATHNANFCHNINECLPSPTQLIVEIATFVIQPTMPTVASTDSNRSKLLIIANHNSICHSTNSIKSSLCLADNYAIFVAQPTVAMSTSLSQSIMLTFVIQPNNDNI